jgi:hypothetical protein
VRGGFIKLAVVLSLVASFHVTYAVACVRSCPMMETQKMHCDGGDSQSTSLASACCCVKNPEANTTQPSTLPTPAQEIQQISPILVLVDSPSTTLSSFSPQISEHFRPFQSHAKADVFSLKQSFLI